LPGLFDDEPEIPVFSQTKSRSSSEDAPVDKYIIEYFDDWRYSSSAGTNISISVKWLNYTAKTWEPVANLQHTIIYFNFLNAHPELRDRFPPFTGLLPPTTPGLTQPPSNIIPPRIQDAPAANSAQPAPFDSRLIGLNFADWHHLLWVQPTLEFIPESCLGCVRNAFIHVMKKLKDNPQDILHWKKLFLLPTILLTFNNKTKDEKQLSSKFRKAQIFERTNLILLDDWDSFILGALPLRTTSSNLTDSQKESIKQKKIEKFSKAGEIGRAMKLSTQQTTGSCSPSMAIVQKLRDLHPDPSEYTIDPVTLHNMKNIDMASSCGDTFEMTPSKLRNMFQKSKSLVTPGIDGLRNEHLRALFGSGKPEVPTEQQFAELFTAIIILIMDVTNTPAEVYSFLRLNYLIALPKDGSAESIRPIGIGSLYRTTPSTFFLNYTFQSHPSYNGESFNTAHFRNLQYGVDSKGTEKITHYFETYSEVYPENDIFFADAANAFNSLSRLQGLEQVFKYFPQMIPFLMNIYHEESFGCYFGLKEGVQKIPSKEGFHQGCRLACWLYSMSFQPFLKQLSAIVNIEEDGAIKAYVDDSNLGAPTTKMIEAIRHIQTEGKKIGFTLNPKKGALLLGKCATHAEAATKKLRYITELGLHPDTIKIHPENQNSRSDRDYGAKVLGAYIGQDEFVEDQLKKKESELTQVRNGILSVTGKQIKFLMLSMCFVNKLNHLQRTMPPDKLTTTIAVFQDLKRDILEDIIGAEVDNAQWKLAQLPISESGLGLIDCAQISHAAYVASTLECYCASSPHEKDLFHRAQALELMCITNTLTSIQVLHGHDTRITLDSIITSIKEGNSRHLQNTLSETFKAKSRLNVLHLFQDEERVHLNSIHNDHSGKFLQCLPKSDLHSFNNREMTSALVYRLYMHQHNLINQPCPCTHTRKFTIDPQGKHFATGCNLGGARIATHNDITRFVATLCNYAEVRTKFEQTQIFQGNDQGIGDNSRGDLTLVNLNIHPLIVDFSITSTVPPNGGTLTNAQIRNPDYVDDVLNKRANEKNNRYKIAARNVGYDFTPGVIDIGGRLEKTFKTLLEQLVHKASESRNIPFSILWHYWLSALMVTLQKGRARAIFQIGSKVFGRQSRDTFETSDQVVSRSTYINRH
jgi:hypothetical protein